jgi:hypothetical protein
MKRLKRFAGLPAKEKRLLVDAVLIVLAASVAVAAMPFSLLQSWASRKSRLKVRENFSQTQIGWAVSAAIRYLPWSTCLGEALAMQVLLRQSGYHPVIRVGVRKTDDGEFTAHAWVENEGKIVAGDTGSLTEYAQMSVF